MRPRVLGSLVLTAWLISCGDQPTEPAVQDVPRSIAFATSSTEDGLSITTDKDDYQPGDTVHLTGTGWQPFDVLDILLVDEPQTHEPRAWAVSAGMDGSFHDSTYVVEEGDLNVTFTLTATSRLTGRSLTVVFTDNITNIFISHVTPLGLSWNPSSDGGNEQTTIRVQNGPGGLAGVSLRIRAGTAQNGTIVKSFSPSVNLGSNGVAFFHWDGRNNAGVLAPDGIYTARITAGVSELQGVRRTIWVDNTNPTVTIDPLPPIVRNQPFTITGTAADLPAAIASGVAEVEVWIRGAFCDGVFDIGLATNTGTNFSTWSFTYTHTHALDLCVNVFAEDNSGNEAFAQSDDFTPGDDEENEAPTANAGGPYTTAEGTTRLLDGSGSSDPDAGSTLTYAWSVDFTTTAGEFVGIDAGGQCRFFSSVNAPDPGTPTSSLQQPSVRCTDDGVFRLTLTVTDDEGESATAVAKLTVTNVNPSATALTTNSPVHEGSGITLSLAGVADPSSNDAAGLRYAFDCGAGDGFSATDYAGAGAANSATCSTDDNGTRTVKGKVFDNDGGVSDVYQAVVQINNVEPTATSHAPAAVDEGSPFMLSLTNPHDPSSVDVAAGLQYAFDCGDGAGYGPLGSATARSCPTTDDATRMVKGKIQDKDGGLSEYPSTVEVENVAPTILTWTPSPTSVIIGATLDFTATFSDPGADTHTAEVDCGSGYGAGAGAASPLGYSCTFSSIGQHTIKIRIQDDDGGADEGTHTLTVVYNFSGFFAPVDRPNIMNVSKAGQTIPLKWRLTNASGQGVTGVTGVTVQSYGISCALGSNDDVMEESAAGSSGLQDKGDGYYQFNWQTPESYLGTCKSIALVFGSGGMGYTEKPSAFFSFTK